MTFIARNRIARSKLSAAQRGFFAEIGPEKFLKIFLSLEDETKFLPQLEQGNRIVVTYSLQAMARGRWKLSPEMAAAEAFAVFIRHEKPTRTRSKKVILPELANPEATEAFLKLCLEYDDTLTLRQFRAGLLCVIRAIGPERFAKRSGIHRVSLYRMLSPKGNPRLEGLMRILKALRVSVWIVDQDFIARRGKFVRPKDMKPEHEFVKKGRKVPQRIIKL